MKHSIQPGRFWRPVALIATFVLGWYGYWRITGLPVTVLRDQKIRVGSDERTYRLVVPEAIDASSSIPLLVALHGAGDTTEQMAEYTDLDRLAAEHGFCLLYLQGWNDSWPPFIPENHPEVVDREIAFFDSACDEVMSRYPIQRKRVYLVGMSQGAAFLHILIAKRSHRIAAAASHSGWLPDPLGPTCLDTRQKCPMLFVVGTDDKQVSPESVTRARDRFAAAGHPAKLIQLQGVGHCWAKDRGINATIWQFLSAHELADE